MTFKNTFRVFVGNARVIYHAMFYRLFITCFIGLIAYFLVIPDLKFLFDSDEVKNIWSAVIGIFSGIIKGNGIDTEALPTAFDAFVLMLKDNVSTIVVIALEVSITWFVYLLLERMGNFAIAYIYDGYMSALTKFGFGSTLVLNAGKAAFYALIMVPIVMVFDVIIIGVSVLIAVYGIRVISVFAIIFALIFLILAFSFKYTIFSAFLPNMITKKQSVGKAFVNTFKGRKNLFTLMGVYAFVVMISFYLNVSVMTFTVFVGLFVSIPITSIFHIIVGFVDFYQVQGKKFYVDSETIVIPKQLQENAEYLKYM